jgi:ribosomal protein L11 methyltransferase
MDPGSAFGTGSHPTTRLCLEAIEGLAAARGHRSGGPPNLGPIRVADLGCGSGILGLAALLQGAKSLAAVDTDPLAVRASRENLASSGVEAAVKVGQGSVETLATLLEGQPADLLLCNILAPVIEALCPAFHTLLAADGVGLLSGLLVDQAPGLQQALAAEGWRAELSAQQGRWGLMVLHKAH